MAISIHRTEIPPSSTHIFIQSSSRDTCIRYNPISSYEYTPRLSFKPFLWILLLLLVAFSVAAIVMGEAFNFPLVRREGKHVMKNVTYEYNLDVLVEGNDTDDVLYRDQYDDDSIADEHNGNRTEDAAYSDDGYSESLNTTDRSEPDAKAQNEISATSQIDVNISDAASSNTTNSTNTKDNAGVLESISSVVEAAVNTTMTALSAGLLKNTTTQNVDSSLSTRVNDTSNVQDSKEQPNVSIDETKEDLTTDPIESTRAQADKEGLLDESDQAFR